MLTWKTINTSYNRGKATDKVIALQSAIYTQLYSTPGSQMAQSSLEALVGSKKSAFHEELSLDEDLELLEIRFRMEEQAQKRKSNFNDDLRLEEDLEESESSTKDKKKIKKKKSNKTSVEEFEVDKIVDFDYDAKENRLWYLVFWVGWEKPSWTPVDHLDCPRKIAEFMTRLKNH